jgi:ABC-type microcin C transport system permease subunit YejE
MSNPEPKKYPWYSGPWWSGIPVWVLLVYFLLFTRPAAPDTFQWVLIVIAIAGAIVLPIVVIRGFIRHRRKDDHAA